MGLLTKFLERKREEEIYPYIKGKVLDIGCGPANALKNKKITKYYGTELNKNDVERLSKKYPNANFFCKDIENDNIELKEKVDVVIMTAFLEHLANYENAIEQSIKNLREGGLILITTPSNFGHKVHNIGAQLGLFSKEAAEDHKSILSKTDFIRLKNKFNLKLKKYKKFEFFCNQLVIYEK